VNHIAFTQRFRGLLDNLRLSVTTVPSLLTILIALLLIGAESRAVVGGTNVSGDERHTGIFRITTYDGPQIKGYCTATVLYASASARRTWLVTAGHCFSNSDDAHFVWGHFSNPRARVRYRRINGSRPQTASWNSAVYVHPEWLSNGGHTAWFGPRDMAFIRVDQYIPVYDENDQRITEYRRPIFTGPAEFVSEPFVSSSRDNFAQNVFCGQGSGSLRCDRLRNLWYSPGFRHQFLQLPHGAWTGGFYQGGDSGGPLLKYAPGLAREWNGAGSDAHVARHGVVLGVLQGPTVWCDYIQNGNCNPGDGLATRFMGVESWLGMIPGSNVIPRLYTWSFNGMFKGGTGTRTNLSTFGSHDYTRPAYPTRVVGIGIDKQNNRVNVWYENGFRTTGSTTDLDLFSQFPDPRHADVMPTLGYSVASGKQRRDIVGMIMAANGRVYTFYRDGTRSIGTPSDLDRWGAPQTYSVASGKSIDDIVAMAYRTNGGGVMTFYRDGTVSEGTSRDLDSYGAPTPFNTNTNRGADEIMGADTRSDGRVVTFFEHPALF